MELQRRVNLKPYNTLSLNVEAAYFVAINCLDDLRQARKFCHDKCCPWLLIGGW